MDGVVLTDGLPEPEAAARIDALVTEPGGRERLADLLREDHPLYDQRSTAATVRMRGWILLALARAGLPESALLFVLEDLETGADPYLVSAAARALRSYPEPSEAFAPFVLRALDTLRYRDEPVSFEAYGEYADGSGGTTPVRELLAALEWLGPRARGVLPEVEALRAQPGGLGKRLWKDVDRAVAAIRGEGRAEEPGAGTCCELPGGLGQFLSWRREFRRASGPVEPILFEDQDGSRRTFGELFQGHPSIVVFFYTRCDNPLKCSLTVAKLARVQALLQERGLAGRIHTAAITYDPAFDLPERLRRYGENRGARLDAWHRLLRTADAGDFPAVRRHFELGVNFVESLVNRHRIEVYVLDGEGRIAASFARLHWEERAVVERAAEILEEEAPAAASPRGLPAPVMGRGTASGVLGTLASLGVAFFPKCPVCWAAYLSLFGIAGLQRIPYSPWLQPLLLGVMLINLGSVWLRGRSTGRMSGFYLAGGGALAIALSRVGPSWEGLQLWGVALTLAGSSWSAFSARRLSWRF